MPFNVFSIGRKKERSDNISATAAVSPAASDGDTTEVLPVRRSEI